MNEKIATPIIDRNGKATTVWKRVESALVTNERISGAVNGFGKPQISKALDDTQRENLFTNIKRLRTRDDDVFLDLTGFDKEFQTEFSETTGFDNVSTSLQRMRKDDEGLEKLSDEFTINGTTRTVHFVGTNLENKVQEFQSWLDSGASSFEESNFTANFTQTANEIESKTEAWLSISGDIAWTFDEDTADRLITGISAY